MGKMRKYKLTSEQTRKTRKRTHTDQNNVDQRIKSLKLTTSRKTHIVKNTNTHIVS